MRIWALGDLHLPGTRDKPMDVFGAHWERHAEKIAAAWRARVAPGDVVLLTGDFSWAMRMPEVAEDMAWLGALPGALKLMIRGNHDYWWTTRQKMNASAPPGVAFLHNDAHAHPPFVFAGSRGWDLPSPEKSESDNDLCARLCLREAQRLTRSLEAARAQVPRRLIVLLHFPPLVAGRDRTDFTDVLDRFEPETVVYGHLHGAEAHLTGFQGRRNHTAYVLASADALDFTPVLIAES